MAVRIGWHRGAVGVSIDCSRFVLYCFRRTRVFVFATVSVTFSWISLSNYLQCHQMFHIFNLCRRHWRSVSYFVSLRVQSYTTSRDWCRRGAFFRRDVFLSCAASVFSLSAAVFFEPQNYCKLSVRYVPFVSNSYFALLICFFQFRVTNIEYRQTLRANVFSYFVLC